MLLRDWLNALKVRFRSSFHRRVRVKRRRRPRWDNPAERLERRVLLTTIVVTTTDDSGAGSLRQAILDANSNSGADDITFDIPTSDPGFVDVDSSLTGGDAAADVFVIQLQSDLPTLTNDGTTIDGRTQTTSTGDTNPFGPEIVLDGSGGGTAEGLRIYASNVAVYGLNIQGFSAQGVTIGTGSNNLIAGSYIGTDATGTQAAGNTHGILITSDNNTIGGTTAADRNVISGNNGYGIVINGVSATGNIVEGNYIGTDAGGSGSLPNSSGALDITNSAAVSVGGTFTGNVNNDGTLELNGNSPGILTIAGNYTQTSAGTLDVEIGGTTAGGDYDQLNVSGTATLDGALNVTRINSFAPVAGDSFDILNFASSSGNFAAVNGVSPFDTGLLTPVYTSTGLTLSQFDTASAWNFEQDYTDSSGNGYDLSASGSPSFQADVPAQASGNYSLSIPSGSYVTATGDQGPASNFTVDFYFKNTMTSGTAEMVTTKDHTLARWGSGWRLGD